MSKERRLDELFARAKSAPSVASFEETKSTLLMSISITGTPIVPKKGKGILNFKNLIIMTSILSIMSVGVWLFVGSSTTVSSNKMKEGKVLETLKKESFMPSNESKNTIVKKQLKQYDINPFNLPVASLKIQDFESQIKRDIQFQVLKPVQQKFKLSEDLFFPTLTEKEISDNHKQKRKMIRALIKFDKKSWSYIPAGNVDLNGTTVSLQSIYMQQNEVTNLEYRTFLFDLLIRGKKDEFLLARPDQGKWISVLGDWMQPMQDNYFSHPAYDDYPVVNVSRKGAEMYCVWLTSETNATLKAPNKINNVRLPNRAEWMNAAGKKSTTSPFPWGTESVLNETKCYLANFDSNTYDNSSDSLNKGSDGALLTAKTRTYHPNGYGLYNMSGNVAEMVYNYVIDGREIQIKGDKNGTAGGGWMNTVEDIKINGPDPYPGFTEAHPGIGFRVVVTYFPLGRLMSNEK